MSNLNDVTAQCGTKRKRYGRPQQDLGAKISGKLHHDVRDIKKAAKKAKAFETQKLIKKLKDLRKENKQPQEIAEAEMFLEALKALDHEFIATTALNTKVNKIRILRENSHVQEAMLKEQMGSLNPAHAGSPSAKLQSRLLSSKALAAEITLVVEGLKCIIQPDATDAPDAAAEEDGDQCKRVKKVKKAAAPEPRVPDTSKAGRKGRKEEGRMQDEEDAKDAGLDSEGVSDDEALAEDGWESGSISGGKDDFVIGPNDKELGVPADDPAETSLRTQTRSATAATKTSGIQSTFLPSLSVGFVRGSDDSEFSDSDAKVADIDIKKNRRGQRARRAIWEKKYGKNANHKKKELDNRKAEVDRDRESRSGANPGRHRPDRAKGLPRKSGEMKFTPQAMDGGWGQRTRDEKRIHPSWEAKRRLKEKESASIVASQGKKIIF